MAVPQRFLFDTSFDPDEPDPAEDAVPEPVEEPAPEPPPPAYSEAELEAAREEAFAAGAEAGMAEARTAIERDLAAALQVVGLQFAELVEVRRAADAELAGQAAELALAMVRKMLPDLMGRAGGAEIEALVRGCLADVMEEPRIVIRVADGLLDPMRERLTAVAREHGYEGAVVMVAEPALGPGDVKVEWADGGAERLSKHLWAEIEAAVARLRAPAPKRRGTAEPAPALTNAC